MSDKRELGGELGRVGGGNGSGNEGRGPGVPSLGNHTRERLDEPGRRGSLLGLEQASSPNDDDEGLASWQVRSTRERWTARCLPKRPHGHVSPPFSGSRKQE